MTPHVETLAVEQARVASGGAMLAVYRGGNQRAGAPPLVFLHAGVCDSRMWAGQFDAFGADRDVVAYDRRGFGATAAVDEHFSSVDDLWTVLDALAIDRAVLIGCSQGGRIALDAALDRPGRVAALVLVAAAIGGAPEEATHDARLDGFVAAHDQAKDAGDVAAQNRIEAQIWLDGPFEPEGRVAGPARDLFLEMNGLVLGGPKVGSTTVPDTAHARLGDVSMPTLVIWGPLDVPSVSLNMKHAAQTIPGARACELEGVAHLPSLEAPDRFDAALSAFLHDAALT